MRVIYVYALLGALAAWGFNLILVSMCANV